MLICTSLCTWISRTPRTNAEHEVVKSHGENYQQVLLGERQLLHFLKIQAGASDSSLARIITVFTTSLLGFEEFKILH